MKKLFLLLLPFILFAITPKKELTATSGIKDIALCKDTIIAGSEDGKVTIYNLQSFQVTKTFQLPKIKDFMGDLIDAPIGSVDCLNKSYLVVSDSGIGGYGDVWLIKENNLTKVFSAKDKLSIIKAKFINENKILLGLLSNEAYLFDLTKKKFLYKKQLTPSKFSDFTLNQKRDKAVFVSESGKADLISTQDGKLLQSIDMNLDMIFQVAFYKHYIATASKDRSATIYNITNQKKRKITSHFFVYNVALNDKYIALMMDEKNNITIFDLDSLEKKYTLKGHSKMISKLIFFDKNRLISAGKDGKIYFWELP